MAPAAAAPTSTSNTELRHSIGDLERRLGESQAETSAVSRSIEEYRQRCAQLQVELDTSEHVQKDFVRLSQQLQIQLEKLRESENEVCRRPTRAACLLFECRRFEVRWQFREDTNECNACEADLKRLVKANCLHCGKVFCPKCVDNTILSGPNSRQAKVRAAVVFIESPRNQTVVCRSAMFVSHF